MIHKVSEMEIDKKIPVNLNGLGHWKLMSLLVGRLNQSLDLQGHLKLASVLVRGLG